MASSAALMALSHCGSGGIEGGVGIAAFGDILEELNQIVVTECTQGVGLTEISAQDGIDRVFFTEEVYNLVGILDKCEVAVPELIRTAPVPAAVVMVDVILAPVPGTVDGDVLSHEVSDGSDCKVTIVVMAAVAGLVVLNKPCVESVYISGKKIRVLFDDFRCGAAGKGRRRLDIESLVGAGIQGKCQNGCGEYGNVFFHNRISSN